MSIPSRTPPRFVPTLTAVVDVDAPAQALAAPDPDAVHEATLSQSEVPAKPAQEPAAAGGREREGVFVPGADVAAFQALSPAERAAISDADVFRIEEELLHRVLQRIDLSLEEQLTEAVSAAVQRQLDAMLPALRSEIESVLRGLVVDAMAQELSADAGPAPGSHP